MKFKPYQTMDEAMAEAGAYPFVGPLRPAPLPPTTPREKWERLNNPQCIEDYGVGMSLDEIRAVPEALAEVRSYLPPGTI